LPRKQTQKHHFLLRHPSKTNYVTKTNGAAAAAAAAGNVKYKPLMLF